ncbi:MAG TPA: hypothetical protein VGM90_06005 [Kofleriaceae bacterium]|jgi:hypothetical protein
MKAIRVRVENGRITGDAPPGIPDGELDLCIADDDDAMTPDELDRLNEALDRGAESVEAGRFKPAAEVVDRLRGR